MYEATIFSDAFGGTVENVEVSGHIIDSLILPKILDQITAGGGTFQIKQIAIGQGQSDPSHALVQIEASSAEQLQAILRSVTDHGAVPVGTADCQLVEVELDGVFPEGFYSTTNQRSELRIGGQWHPVELQEMDCAIAWDIGQGRAVCVAMSDVRRGQQLVVGHAGVRVFPPQRAHSGQGFEFMNSQVSTEKPKGLAVRNIARQLTDARNSGGKTLIVGGPAIVHTGSGEHLRWMIEAGYVDVLFAGNALATHDIEQSMFGTCLGVNLEHGDLVEAGHQHHLRAINRVRRCGSIAQAVEAGLIESGIFHDCVKHSVDFVLAGSIRDDGPLPDVITDSIEAQRVMREKIAGVTVCLMIATTLHSIAVGNLLSADVQVVCVDINPSAVIKLSDRGSFQTVGLVTDVEPFMRALVEELKRTPAQTQ